MVEFQSMCVCGTITRKGKLITNNGYLISFILSITSYKFCTPETTNMYVVASSNEAIEISNCELGDRVMCTLEYETKSYMENQDKKFLNHFKVLRVAKLQDKNVQWIEWYNSKKNEEDKENNVVIASDTSLL